MLAFLICTAEKPQLNKLADKFGQLLLLGIQKSFHFKMTDWFLSKLSA